MRGFFGMGIYNPKAGVNIGTLWRSAYIYNAAFIFTVGRRYKKQSSDTMATPRHVPLHHYLTLEECIKYLPYDTQLVCVENKQATQYLNDFNHPQRAVYLLGSEDGGLPENILKDNIVVQIKSPKDFCFNVATAGSIVMYDRFIKGEKK